MSSHPTTTGGREATTRHIMGDVALAVGAPQRPAPAGWKWVPLTKVARMESGHTPSRNHPEYWGGDISWIGIKDAKAHHGGVITETLENTNDLGIANSSSRVLPAGTVCVSRTASVGYVTTMGRDMATSQDFANWVCTDAIDPRFLAYVFIAEKEALHRFASGAVHSTIYFPELKAFHVALPPLIEQKRIVRVLDEAIADLDQALENVAANLKDVDALYQSVLAEMLVQGEHSDTSRTTLGTLVTIQSGFAFKSSEYVESGHFLVRISNVQDGYLDLKNPKFVQLDSSTSRFELEAGDFLTSLTGEIGRVARVESEHLPAALNQRVARIGVKLGQNILAEYLYLFLRSPAFSSFLAEHSRGVAQANVSPTVIKDVPIALPSLAEQRRIIDVINSIDQHRSLLQTGYTRNLQDYSDLRRSILLKCLGGG